MKIAINQCYEGFSVSSAVAKILKKNGVQVTLNGEYYPDGSGPANIFMNGYHLDNEEFGIKSDNHYAYRIDKRLIEAIEKVGIEKASGDLAEIEIIEIPDDIEWKISDYDGIETIHEKHRSWG